MSKGRRLLAIVLLLGVPLVLGPVATITSSLYTARDITLFQDYCGMPVQYTLFGFPIPWFMKYGIVGNASQCSFSGICTRDCPAYFWEAFWIDMVWYTAVSAAGIVAILALAGRKGFQSLGILGEVRVDRRKTRIFVTSAFLLCFLGLFFLAPIVGVDGIQNFPAGHCPARTDRWIDWHSLGYQFLSVGYSYRMWIEWTLCF